MAKEIRQLPEVTAPATTDWYILQKSSNNQTSKVSGSNMIPNGSVDNTKLSTTVGEPGGNWKPWTPTITATTGTFTTLTTTAEYTLIGKTCFYHIKVIENNIGTASGNFIFTIPLTANINASYGLCGTGREDAITGNTLLVRYQDNTHFFTSSAIAANYQLVISGFYPIA